MSKEQDALNLKNKRERGILKWKHILDKMGQKSQYSFKMEQRRTRNGFYQAIRNDILNTISSIDRYIDDRNQSCY